MELLILAAGRGNRMGALTRNYPKALMPLPGGTILDHLLEGSQLTERFTRVNVVVGHQANRLRRALNGIPNVRFIPQRRTFSVLNAILAAESYIQDQFIVLHSDNYYSHTLGYAIDRLSQFRFACLVDPRNRHLPLPDLLANSGCYVLSPEVFGELHSVSDKDDTLFMIDALLRRGINVVGVDLVGERFNINKPADLARAAMYILANWEECYHPQGSHIGFNAGLGPNCTLRPPYWVHVSSPIGNSTIGPFAAIAENCTVQDSSLSRCLVFPGTNMRNASIADAIVMQDTIIRLGA